MLGNVVCCILCMSVLCERVSKALERSSAATAVLAGGFFLLNPSAIEAVISYKAEVVDLPLVKPCWHGWFGKCSDRVGRMILSKTLIAGERREMGL